LLGTRCHAIGFVENDELLSALWESDLLLSEALDTVPYDIDTYKMYVSKRILGLVEAIEPLSSLALSSKTASLYEFPNNCLARHSTDVVFPIPGIPEIITCGIFPSFAIIFNRSIVSVLPTISSKKTGRYFSTPLKISV
jgi:hypothetical protein